MNARKSWPKRKDLNDDTVKYEVKDLGEFLSRFFAEIPKRWVWLQAEHFKGHVCCSRKTPQTEWNQRFHSEGSKIVWNAGRSYWRERQELFTRNASRETTMQVQHKYLQLTRQLWKNGVLGEQSPKSFLDTW